MAATPPTDDKVFRQLALDALRYLNFRLVLAVPDLKADRGPYAFTAGVFFSIFTHIHRSSVLFAILKICYGTKDPQLKTLCVEVESILKRLEEEVVEPLGRLARNKRSIWKALFSDDEQLTSLAAKLEMELQEMDNLVAKTESVIAQWN